MSYLKLAKMEEKFYNGTPNTLIKGLQYDIEFKFVLKNGQFLFHLCGNDSDTQDSKHGRYVDEYFPHPWKFKMRPDDICEFIMVMVIDQSTGEQFRGQVYGEPNRSGEVMVMNVDAGEMTICRVSNFHYITREYIKEPYDSSLVHLDGLIFFEGTNVMLRACEIVWQDLPNKRFLATCMGYDGGLPVLQLLGDEFNTSLNTKMLEYVMKNSPGIFPEKGDKTKTGTVSHVEANGLLFLHMTDSFVFDMEEKIEAMTKNMSQRPEQSSVQIAINKFDVYLAPDNGTLYRCKVLRMIQSSRSVEKKVQVRFMDYGNTAILMQTDLILAREFSIAFQEIPPLAHMVFLKWIKTIVDVNTFMSRASGHTFIVEVRAAQIRGINTVSLLLQDDEKKTVHSFNKAMIDEELAIQG